jgi:hypothetical protein
VKGEFEGKARRESIHGGSAAASMLQTALPSKSPCT